MHCEEIGIETVLRGRSQYIMRKVRINPVESVPVTLSQRGPKTVYVQSTICVRVCTTWHETHHPGPDAYPHTVTILIQVFILIQDFRRCWDSHATNPCCMCSCIVSFTAQVRLIWSWCMKICLRRAANISANGYANEYRYGYGYRSLVCIHTRLLASRRSVNQQVWEASKVTTRPYLHRC